MNKEQIAKNYLSVQSKIEKLKKLLKPLEVEMESLSEQIHEKGSGKYGQHIVSINSQRRRYCKITELEKLDKNIYSRLVKENIIYSSEIKKISIS